MKDGLRNRLMDALGRASGETRGETHQRCSELLGELVEMRESAPAVRTVQKKGTAWLLQHTSDAELLAYVGRLETRQDELACAIESLWKGVCQ